MSTFLSERVRRNAILNLYDSGMRCVAYTAEVYARGPRTPWQVAVKLLAIEVACTCRQLCMWHGRWRHGKGVMRMLCVSCYTSMNETGLSCIYSIQRSDQNLRASIWECYM